MIVNTCAVTAEGARKARQTVRRLRRENPDALTALCGCWSQVDAAEAASLGADVLFGTGDRQGFGPRRGDRRGGARGRRERNEA